ncbi:unnamed protein product [Rhizophagus irregularis]|nr:unnamed protein product [Rhizophagus irregularis]
MKSLQCYLKALQIKLKKLGGEKKSGGDKINSLCSNCQGSFAKMSPETWEKNKLKVKENAKYCKHFNDGASFAFYDKNKKCLVEEIQTLTGKLETSEIRFASCPNCKVKASFTDR